MECPGGISLTGLLTDGHDGGCAVRQPYVPKKVSARTGLTRYTGVYYDDKSVPRSAGTYDEEAEALAAARSQQGRKTGIPWAG